jgi:hypothetical protein
MHIANKARHNTHALRPPIGDYGAAASLEELAKSAVGPDDVALEIDDLAEHFLLEATQATPSSLPPPESPGLESEALEASLGEACFEGQDGRAGQRAFERLWREIISRELAFGER